MLRTLPCMVTRATTSGCTATRSLLKQLAPAGVCAATRMPVRFLSDEKPSSPEYHRHSTRYRVTTRDTLKTLEDLGPEPTYQPKSLGDKLSFKTVKILRKLSDMYFKDRLIERALMLETIAAVPGMVASVIHHTGALRNLKHCQWVKPTMDEAENERMHLMTFMEIEEASKTQRLLILAGQAFFTTAYFPFYILFPRTMHRFVGYLEEEACSTYTKMLKHIDEGKIENVPAPRIAIDYWGLPADARLRDVVLVIRADEADHRLVNHYMSSQYDHKHEKHIASPCDKFEVNLDQPMQTELERQIPEGPYFNNSANAEK